MAQLGHVWTQVGLSMRAMVLCGGIWCRSWAQDSQKNVGNSGKNASFQRVALGPQNWLGLSLTWARKGAKRPAEVGPKAMQMDPKKKQGDADRSPSHVHSGATWDPFKRSVIDSKKSEKF